MGAHCSTKTAEKVNLAQRLAEELRDSLKSWIPSRKRTEDHLLQIANELDNIHEDVNVVKVLGTTVSIIGGVVGIAGIIMTGGLAAPAVIGGATAAVAGAATSGGADIIGHLKSNGKLVDAQRTLDVDRELVEKIERIKSKLDTLSIELSETTEFSPEQVFGALMSSTMGSRRRRVGNSLNFQLSSAITFTAIGLISLKLLSQTGKGMAAIGKGMTMTLTGISTRAAVKAAGSVLVSVTGILLVWDVVNLVQTSIDLNKGSKTAAAASLCELAGKLRHQMNELEDFLKEIETQNQDYESSIRKTFRKLLVKISMKRYATNEETKQVHEYVEIFCSPEWRESFLHLLNRESFAFELSRIFHIFGQQIEKHLKKKNDKSKLTIIVIAHGNIDTSLMFPSQFYYMNSSLKTVTLYEPWGCAIDASVVYGIANNTIRINNVSYTGQVRPARPLTWNILPSSGPTVLIPTPIFSPVVVGEGAYMELMRIYGILQGVSDGLVIPYFTGDGNDILPLPSVPLWVVTNVTAICAVIFNIKIHFRCAACLTVPEPSRETGHVQYSQYCTVNATKKPPVMMTNHFNEAERIIIRRLEKLNNYL